MPNTINYTQLPITQTNTQNHTEFCNVFYHSFAQSEGEAEGQTIKTLVRNFLTTTASEDIYAFCAYTANQPSNDPNQLVGAVILTRLFNDAGVELFMLSPMAVLPTEQGTGVGQGLIRHALDTLKANGVQAVVTYGDIKFYGKLGFEPISEDIIPAPQSMSHPEGWLALSLTDDPIPVISGKTRCVEAIADKQYW